MTKPTITGDMTREQIRVAIDHEVAPLAWAMKRIFPIPESRGEPMKIEKVESADYLEAQDTVVIDIEPNDDTAWTRTLRMTRTEAEGLRDLLIGLLSQVAYEQRIQSEGEAT